MSNPILGALGNDYCGPYISDGQFQTSVEGYATARSALQQSCKEHDAAYARGDDLSEADRIFVHSVTHLGKDVSTGQMILGRLFGTAVSLNDVYRYLNGSNDKNIGSIGYRVESLLEMSYNKKRAVSGSTFSTKIISQPSTIGTGLVLQPIVVTRHGGGIKVRGSEFTNPSSPGDATHTTKWKPVVQINLNPAYFENSRLGNYCKLYNKFKFTKFRLNYITNVGTNTSGNILVEYMPSVGAVHRNYNSSTFLNQVMGNAGSCLMPIWENFKIDIPIQPSDLREIVGDSTTDFRELSDGNIVVYGGKLADTTSTGYYVAEYECIFDSPSMSPRLNDVPYPASWSWQYMQLYNSVAAVAGADVLLSESTAALLKMGGYIYKIVFDVTSAVVNALGAGTVSSVLMANMASKGGSASTTTVTTCLDGFTCYGMTAGTGVSNQMSLYTTQSGAFAGRDDTDKLVFINTVALTACDFKAWVTIIRDNNYDNQADA